MLTKNITKDIDRKKRIEKAYFCSSKTHNLSESKQIYFLMIFVKLHIIKYFMCI